MTACSTSYCLSRSQEHRFEKRSCLMLLTPVGIGTAMNVVVVLVGGSIGTRAGAKPPEGMRRTAMHAIGIVTLLVRVSTL